MVISMEKVTEFYISMTFLLVSVKLHAKIFILGLIIIIKLNCLLGLCFVGETEVGMGKIIWSLRILACFYNIVKSKDLGFRLPGFETWFGHLLYRLSFLICKTAGVTVLHSSTDVVVYRMCLGHFACSATSTGCPEDSVGKVPKAVS